MRDTRQIFLTVEQAQMAQLHPRQARFKSPLAVEGDIELSPANARLVVTGIIEISCAAPCHLPLPYRLGEPMCDPRSAISSISYKVAGRIAAVYANSASAKAMGTFWDFRRSSGGRRSDAEGASPNSARYSTEKRPSSQKPNSVAIWVTVDFVESASTSACRARCILRSQRYRIGPIPKCSWQMNRNVRSDTPIAVQISARYRG